VKESAAVPEPCGRVVCGESYRPRQPEQTVLYQVLAEHLETFLVRERQQDRHIPAFVEREFRKFLECGIAACGFLRLVCQKCGQNKVVAYSCYPQQETIRSSSTKGGSGSEE